jgi:WD40 repeat protein/serine/threonine protein kinase
MVTVHKHFTCPNGHHWEVPLGGPLDVPVECICCPECGGTAETLPPGGSSPVAGCTPPDLPAPEPFATITPSAAEADTPAEAAAKTAIPPVLANHPRYQVLAPLGAGGMGSVYKAEHRLMERLVALKVINPRLTADAEAVGRFRREVKAAARLNHPNIVTAYDAEQAGDIHFLVMEYVEGLSLAHWVQQEGPLPVRRACDFVRQAALGLQHAYEQGMVHRDVKPQNLMLTKAQGSQTLDLVKVLDFGLARFASEKAPIDGLTQDNAVMGTPDYIAPEQADDARQADIRADVYSLGCTLYFLMTGQVPFPRRTIFQKLLAHRVTSPPQVSALRKDVPPELVRVLERMMAKEPAKRYQTPAEAAEALAPFANPPPATQAPRHPWRRLAILGAVLSAGLVLLGAIFTLQTKQGTLTVNVPEADVKVLVDGEEKIVIDSRKVGRIELRPGPHSLVVKRGEDELYTDKFTLKSGGAIVIEAHWQPKTEAVKQRGNAGLPLLPRSAFDDLRPERMSAYEWAQAGGGDSKRAPPGLVAVLGDSRLMHWNTVSEVAFADGGKTVLSASLDGTVRAWDRATGQCPHLLPPDGFFSRKTDAIEIMAVDEKGTILITSHDLNGLIRVWDLATWQEKEPLPFRTGIVALSGNGKVLAHASGPALEVGELAELAARKPPRACQGHTGAIERIALNRDGLLLASTAFDGTVRLWDAATGKELRLLGEHRGNIHAVAFSPDGKRLAGGADDLAVVVWDVGSGKVERTLRGQKSQITAVAFSPDGKSLASAGNDLKVWDLDQGKDRLTLSGLPSGARSTLSFSPDGKVLAWGHDQVVTLLDAASGKELPGPLSGGHFMHLALSPDGRTLALTTRDRRVQIREAASGEVRRTLSGFTRDILPVDFSPDSKRLAVPDGGNGGRVTLWDVAKGEELARCDATDLYNVVFSADGSWLAFAQENVVDLWEPATGRHRSIGQGFQGGEGIYPSVAFSSDGQLLAAAGRIFDVSTGKERCVLQAEPRGGLWSWQGPVVFSPDGKLIASGRWSKVWDVATGQPRRQLPSGHHAVAFSPDGRTLASAGYGSAVMLWDVDAPADNPPRETIYLGPANSWILELAFSPDGRHLLALNPNRTVYVLRLAPEPEGH